MPAPRGPALTLAWASSPSSAQPCLGPSCASQPPRGPCVGEAHAPAGWLGSSPALILLRLRHLAELAHAPLPSIFKTSL